jgi:phosphoribosylglycinamide formyltransferase-1
MTKLRLGVLISGRGSNLQALIDACEMPNFPAEIVLVVCNCPGAEGLTRAVKADIETMTIDHRDFETRARFDDAVDLALRDKETDLVCLAGFMRLLGDGFVRSWHDKLINIHPALLPAFKGINAVAQALDAGVKVTGCTVHFVRTAMDSGPIILQTAVPVRPGDDEEILGARIRAAEHSSYVEAVQLIADGRVWVTGQRVVVSDK